MTGFDVFAEAGRLEDDPDVDLQITRGRGFFSVELTADEASEIVDGLTTAIELAEEEA